MKAILKIVRSQIAQVGVTTIFGAALGAAIALILRLLHDWIVVGFIGLTPPPSSRGCCFPS